MPYVHCNSCPSTMQAKFHIERAWMLLNAAHETHELSGTIYRNTLAVAIRALGEAAAALQIPPRRQPSRSGSRLFGIKFHAATPHRCAYWFVVTTGAHPTPARTVSIHTDFAAAQAALVQLRSKRAEVSHG